MSTGNPGEIPVVEFDPDPASSHASGAAPDPAPSPDPAAAPDPAVSTPPAPGPDPFAASGSAIDPSALLGGTGAGTGGGTGGGSGGGSGGGTAGGGSARGPDDSGHPLKDVKNRRCVEKAIRKRFFDPARPVDITDYYVVRARSDEIGRELGLPADLLPQVFAYIYAVVKSKPGDKDVSDYFAQCARIARQKPSRKTQGQRKEALNKRLKAEAKAAARRNELTSGLIAVVAAIAVLVVGKLLGLL